MTRAQLTDVEWEFTEPYLPIGECQDVIVALEKAAAEEEEVRAGGVPRDEAGRTVVPIPSGTSGDASGAGAGSG
ncbi:hypothetical protein [Streptomyces capitiformicae]|uniref:Uncharacterized protein n=1 Tax=Streptomyces capitiformicae TaxID=2014920 RepID=A0A919GC71_9ACTN|nr:hypothetical protein GCM10017771_03720 [Streptomyces capitiformicae]